MLLFLTFVLFITHAIAEVTILKATQYIYDQSPKLRIRGSGFDVDARDIILELNANGRAPLIINKDYLVTKDPDGDGLILKLLENRRWVDTSSRIPPIALVLFSVKFNRSNKNLIPDPIIIAQVLNTPTIRESTQPISQTSSELIITGTGLIGSQGVHFYFQPPLAEDIAYDHVLTKYPLQKNQIVLRLRNGYTWREVEGPLRIIGVDSGGGPVKVRGDEGVVIANIVRGNVVANQLVVDRTIDRQLIYADTPNLVITGFRFNPSGNSFRFENGLIGGGLNFTTVSTSDSRISLRLVHGSLWRKDLENLPGPLTVLAMNVGQGFVPVGPQNSDKGRDVALVFERPNIFPDDKSIYRTQTQEFHIKGTGFPAMLSSYKPMLKFYPPLTEGKDYALRVVNRTDLEVTLLDGKVWVPSSRGSKTSLYVIAINTRGDDTGWMTFDGDGVQVAQVVDDIGEGVRVTVKDIGNKESSVSEVAQDVESTVTASDLSPLTIKVYQSESQQKIEIIGKGFSKGVSFSFDSSLKAGINYEVDTISDTK
eukprot:gene14061-15536_t